ncbi:MAG: undecaprenyldiphospho-muramoylpentapeptide beta-N-acetylglucosaminyltransferase [Gemmatimonadota bacterium]
MRSPTIVLSGGGTGGHLYPALAIADALREARPDVTTFFVGAERGIEARVLPERGEDHLLLPLHGIDRRNVLGSWRAFTGLLVGLVRVARLFRRLRPDLVVVTGGYAGAAAGAAAGLMGIPLVLQEQNSYPGLVTRLLTRFATRVHVAYPEALDRLAVRGGRWVVSGNPVRDPAAMEKSVARRAYDVPEEVVLTLVTGGSQGSLALNRGVTEWVRAVVSDELDRSDALHVLWATGRKHFDSVRAELDGAGDPEWVHALPYLDDMPSALAAADFALCRAGAMTTAELLNQGLPAILVPLPTAAENHQMHNARALEVAGAAGVIPEADMTAARLGEALNALAGDPARVAAMGERALERARPEATRTIASDLAALLPPLRRAA